MPTKIETNKTATAAENTSYKEVCIKHWLQNYFSQLCTPVKEVQVYENNRLPQPNAIKKQENAPKISFGEKKGLKYEDP